jgi:hypothetical protein
MTRKEFEAEYGLTRRQTDRLFAAAREGDGTFDLPDRGRFRVEKGKRRTDPIRISTVTQTRRAPSAAPNAAPVSGMEHLPKAELDRLLVLANIRKTQQQVKEERERIRAEAFAEIEVEMAQRFARLREALDTLRLPPEALRAIREALDGE